ncbi:MAG: TAXI family TRAP transporter solute-binding subunit [Hyphomicrobiaceae bacterium]|nr:TAXI family TRAP transporter solute-binding subunit [Hyphomicrobiaceae bacterium]
MFFSIYLLAAGVAAAQTEEDIRDRVNRGTVGIVSGSVTGTYIRIASDLASVLNGSDLRVLVTSGLGSVQNVDDLLYLRGIDAAIVQSDVLEHIKRQKKHANIQSRINYVTKLYNEEFHLLASKSVRSIQELQGQPVILGNIGSGSHMTASIVFEILGINVRPVPVKDHDTALQMLKDGRVKAWIRVTGKPNSSLAQIKPDSNIKLLSVPPTPALLKTYLPSTLTAKDYPNLVPQGASVQTIAIGAVLAVYAWKSGHPRYTKVSRFVDAFFQKFANREFFKPQRHKKWQEVNLAAKLPGWTRYAPATQWLARTPPALSAQGAGSQFDQQRLLNALRSNDFSTLTPEEQKFVKAFRSFVRQSNAKRQ